MSMGILQQYLHEASRRKLTKTHGRYGDERVENPAMALMGLNAPLCQRRLFMRR